jgi:hypothetical protein
MHQLRACVRRLKQESQRGEELSRLKNKRSNNTGKMHKYSTGTDGCRVLCHQFSPSSLLRRANCISRSNRCSLTVKHRTPALLRLLANGDQGQNTRHTVFPLPNGRHWCSVWWSRKNRSVQWQQRMVSLMKRSVVL